MGRNARFSVGALALLVAAGAMACGGSSPAGPAAPPVTTSQGVTLQGTVAGFGSASNSGVFALSTTGQIIVTVAEDPAITTAVGEDGSFVLRGLPEGGFALVFARDGVELGTLSFTELLPNQEIEITVEIADDGVVLLDERRNGIGHGDKELEGVVELVLQVDPVGDSLFLIDGLTVLVQPGQTSIREGGQARAVEDVGEGRQVHVKGVWLAPDGQASEQIILAHEIKLQGEADDDDGDDGQKITICHKEKNTLSISESAWPAHQAHGDTLGPCGS